MSYGRSSGKRGMMLTELLFASGILTLTLVLLFGSIQGLARVREITKGRAAAVAYLNSVLEDVRARSLRDVLSSQPPAPEQLGPDAKVEVSCFDAQGNCLVAPLAPDADWAKLPQPTEVQARVFWKDFKGRACSVSASVLHGVTP